MSTSHSPALIKYIVSPTSPLRKMNSPGANCKVLNLGEKQRSKWVVANSRLNFSFGDFDLHPTIRERWR